MVVNLKEEIKNSDINLIIGSKSNYIENINFILKEINFISNKIGYITLNKPYTKILSDIQKLNLDKNKFFFVDAITATVSSPPIVDNCVFVSSPSALTEISVSFSTLVQEKNADLIFFDTISTLIIYQDIGQVIKFAHNIITKARVLGKKAIFLTLKEDSETLIKDLNMFVDKIIEL
ncbi:MAG: hypothetical protein QXE31_02045 [Candidatus Woesearchaeota archaeon]